MGRRVSTLGEGLVWVPSSTHTGMDTPFLIAVALHATRVTVDSMLCFFNYDLISFRRTEVKMFKNNILKSMTFFLPMDGLSG
jgi:hypothetical protein